jgi:hypothetical protein
MADRCIWMAATQKMRQAKWSDFYADIASARKFVLSDSMSEYMAEMNQSFRRGGLRKRLHLIDTSRQLSRLPHPLIWIEWDMHRYIAYLQKHFQGKVLKFGPGAYVPTQMGWLVRQHAKIETAFKASEFSASRMSPGIVLCHPVSTAWCSDETPSPYQRMKIFSQADYLESQTIAWCNEYNSRQVHWTATIDEKDSVKAMTGMDVTQVIPHAHITDLWALLATINDLPVRIEKVESARGYVARGRYRRFVEHSVIRLTVPETRYRALVIRTSSVLRRRAHQVRGHWRKDWRNPPNKLCDCSRLPPHERALVMEHINESTLRCRKCLGHHLWIHEHQRGDAGLGFVMHDYTVERGAH